ncbi:MAG: putative transporter [Alloprevotella sp.]|nr:putative transporter [Alloprevotella sp.]
MELIHWLDTVLLGIPAIKAVMLISLVCAVGLALGKLHFRGVSLGVAFVFFVGILAGSLGIEIDHDMLIYAEDFGLIIFVYVLGLQVGPGFVSAFRHGGSSLSLISLGLVLFGTLLALVPIWTGGLTLGESMGILCGATTNTPALAAAQQELTQLGRPAEGISAALSLAVTYPVGMVGVIFALIAVKVWLRHKSVDETREDDEAFIASFEVTNPAVFGKSLKEAAELGSGNFVASRIWRAGKVLLPTADTTLQEDDRILVITHPKQMKALTYFFGKRDNTDWNKSDIDWNALDAHLVSERILITRKEVNGRHLGSLHLRQRFGVNVSRVKRSGIQLVATPDLILRFGDRLTVVGDAESCKRVAQELGNASGALEEPNMITIFLGMVLGLVVGYLPIAIPGMSDPIRLGLAGGPIVVGILIGAYGPRFHMVTYVTTSANRLIRSLGLSTYLACLGLDAGPQFVETVMRPAALGWVGYGLLVAFVPVVLFAWVSMRLFRKPFSTTAGMLCGAMANPIALEYVNESYPDEKTSIAYTTVYPLCMFARVIIVQLIVIFFLS